MRILSVVGARPQFVKLAPLHKELIGRHEHLIVHTGQHYDYEMSQVFFEDLRIPDPDHNLGVGLGFHGQQTARMLMACEKVMMEEAPDAVVVYGDTNSTLAGALAAAKLRLPLAHVESGLRSYNRAMPEEVNRVLTDHLSSLLLCPSPSAVHNLTKEGLERGVHMVGDIMMECLSDISGKLDSSLLEERGIARPYLLCTVHRQENADSRSAMEEISGALLDCGRRVVLPLHPRTSKNLEKWGLLDALRQAENVLLMPPQGFLAFTSMEKHAEIILTDSGGVQKEAYYFSVPCVTLREETEWVETVEEGWNTLVGANRRRILDALSFPPIGHSRGEAYGGVGVSGRIRNYLESMTL